MTYDVHVRVPLFDCESLLELLSRRPDHRRRVRDARITRVRAFKVDRVALTIRVQRRDLGVKDVSGASTVGGCSWVLGGPFQCVLNGYRFCTKEIGA